MKNEEVYCVACKKMHKKGIIRKIGRGAVCTIAKGKIKHLEEQRIKDHKLAMVKAELIMAFNGED